MSSIALQGLISALLLSAPFLSQAFFATAWVAFVPLCRAVDKQESLRGAGVLGWLVGFLANLFGFHWLVYTISVFGGFPYIVSVVLFVLYAALQGVQTALFALLLKRFGYGPLFLFPVVFWVAIEFWFPFLFPWHLANSQSSVISFIQTADLVGAYGASFLVMWCNVILARALATRKEGSTLPWVPALICAIGVIGSLAYGHLRLGRVAAEIKAAPKLSVASVQGNIPVGMKWDPQAMKTNLAAHVKLTRDIAGAQLVIWPESAVEEWLPESLPQLPREFIDLLELKGAHFIFGARSFSGTFAGPNFKAFNTAFLTDTHGRVLGRYHKQVLLAFGEYLPFSSILSKLPAMPFADGFTAGDGPRTLDLPGGGKIAPLICYEDLMPELSRAFVRQTKANLLLNITNDAWYGRSVAPWQHAQLAQLRAIETRRTLLRVTNTGATTVIDATGATVQSLPTFTGAVMNANVELLEGETAYVRFGDWFAWGISFISLAVVLMYWKKNSPA
ncbi:MAG: apolipoprotein N-acyltransferase [Deltaproteobacteria bacterium]|nr:apolipoprotein N-acyltransferase [Deltaproteobacteria bacterium]MDZ4347111.1 apolipoprotein N-acyltransferase [Candidatus Binatia bacterium]